MAEKTPNQQLAEKLLYKPAYVADKDADVKQKAHDFAEGYKKFLDAGKTEREVAAESEQMLKDAGYQQFDPKKTYKPGDKIYFVQCNKAVVASTIGTKSFEDGFRLVIAHTDSPRLDLRPTPLYESDHLSYFKTHYYGGVRKYQWGTILCPSTACSPVRMAPPSPSVWARMRTIPSSASPTCCPIWVPSRTPVP